MIWANATKFGKNLLSPKFFCWYAYGCVGSVVEWLKRPARDQHGLGSKPTRATLLCPWERHFTAHSPSVKQFQITEISVKLRADSNILVSPEAGSPEAVSPEG